MYYLNQIHVSLMEQTTYHVPYTFVYVVHIHVLHSGKLLSEKAFVNFTVLCLSAKIFSTNVWECGRQLMAQASNPWKVSL